MYLSKKHLILVAAFTAHYSVADEFSPGIGGIYNVASYKDYKKDVKPIPFAHYEGDNFYFRETSLGYIFAKDSKNEFSATLSYLPYEFDPHDSDNKSLHELDKRDPTALAGVAFYHHEKWGSLKFSVSGDILDKSNGYIAEGAWMRVVKFGQIKLIPTAGVTWYDENLTQYYYGISSREARNSGLHTYQPHDSWNPFVGLGVSYSITPQLTLLTSGRYTLLDNEIKNSPMVDKNYDFSLFTGMSWTL
jgi:outer membrane protein